MNYQAAFHSNELDVIILNFDSGSYYSLNKNAMGIWHLLQAGYPYTAIRDARQAVYRWHDRYIANRHSVGHGAGAGR